MIRIHGLASFDRSAKPRWLLSELGIDFENRWMNREKKEHESPEYLRLNPMGRVPAAEIGDTVIFESGAICAYLADQHLDKGLAPALASPERALYQQWMYFVASTIDPLTTRIMIIEDIPEGALRTEKETALLSDVQDAMATLDRTLSKGSYLLGERFSAADICLGYHLYFCTLWPEFDAIIQKFPSVAAYLQRLKERPAAIRAKAFSYAG